jgi:hypothetical protein
MRKYHLLTLLAALVVSGVSASSSYAFRWIPEGQTVSLNSSNFVFEVANRGGTFQPFPCRSFTIFGVTGSPSATMTVDNMGADNCNGFISASVTGSTLLAESLASAKLSLSAAAMIIFTSGGDCRIRIIQSSMQGVYKNGDGLRFSTWKLVNASVNISQTPNNCFSTATTGRVKATFGGVAPGIRGLLIST